MGIDGMIYLILPPFSHFREYSYVFFSSTTSHLNLSLFSHNHSHTHEHLHPPLTNLSYLIRDT
uniref:Uncharacterized protein n=1 Tax=Oryza brachyantha TaxID=4533 RepID=J3M0U9_ORYBR